MFKQAVALSSLVLIVAMAGCEKGPPTGTTTPVTPNAETNRLAGAQTAMLDRAYNGDTVAVRGLLDQGVDVNMRGKDNNTPIMEAAYAGHIDTVKLLLDRGADLSIRKNDGATVMQLAEAHPEIVELFKDVSLLVQAARSGENRTVNELLDKGTPVNGFDQSGLSALTEASWNGHVETVKILLQNGGDPTMKKADGETPLTLAKSRQHPDVLALLETAVSQRNKSTPTSNGK